MGKREETQEKILKMLRHYGRLTVGNIVSVLNVSEATVRRHFADLEQQGALLRVHGGVRLPVAADANEYLFQREAASRVREKRAIGQAAANLIADRDRIFFDSGTTVLECGHRLSTRLEESELSDVSVVTNSLVYGDSLALQCPVVLTGGTIRPKRMDLCGIVALNNLERYNFTKAVLGADGIADDGALTTTDEETSLLAAAAVAHSQAVLILADGSKLGRSSFVPYGALQGEKFTLITDNQADPAVLENLRKLGINIILADPAKTK